MNEPLSTLEIQLIRALSATKTIDHIAELLEVPAEFVRDKIEELKKSDDILAIQKAREQRPYEFYKHRD